jgi:hypothetical protein
MKYVWFTAAALGLSTVAFAGGGAGPVLSIDDVVTSERAAGTVDFKVQISPPSASAISLHWATEDVTATGGLDYKAGNGTLEIPAGAERIGLSIPLYEDDDHEGCETFYVRLVSVAGAEIPDPVVHGVICDGTTNAQNAGVRGDLDGDGRSDILVEYPPEASPDVPKDDGRKHGLFGGTGTVTRLRLMLDAADWQVEGAADFDGDGACDLLWRDHHLPELVITGVRNPKEDRDPRIVVPESFDLVGAGDLDGNGRADLLGWDSEHQSLMLWRFVAGWRAVETPVYGPVDSRYKPVALARLGASGGLDILWQYAGEASPDPEFLYWQMRWTGQTLECTDVEALALSAETPSDVVAAGDFDGDGNDDLLVQDRLSEELAVWLLRGTALRQRALLSPSRLHSPEDSAHHPESDWNVVGPR